MCRKNFLNRNSKRKFFAENFETKNRLFHKKIVSLKFLREKNLARNAQKKKKKKILGKNSRENILGRKNVQEKNLSPKIFELAKL